MFATVKLHFACGSLHLIKELVLAVKLVKLPAAVTAPTFVAERSIDCSEKQFWNIYDISVTDAVLNELRFRLCSEKQLLNIDDIFVTDAVLNELRFRLCSEKQLLNIYDIFVTAAVLNELKFSDCRE